MATLNLFLRQEFQRLAAQRQRALHFLARLEFPATRSTVSRPPLHLALVLDRSGSMEGDKLALTKRAAIQFIHWLTRRDYATIVTYDDNVDLLVPHTALLDKRAIAAKIEAIQARGSTNLSGGWMRGLAELHEHKQSGHLHRVVLLTDGQANVGVTLPEQLVEIARKNRERDVATTTVGFGSDFNEGTLKAVADQGGGRFHYAKDAEALAMTFQAEFGELATMVAQNIELQAELGPSARLEEVLTDVPHEKTETGFRARLGDARSGDVRLVLFRLALKADALPPGKIFLGSIAARCDALVEDMLPERHSLSLEIELDAGTPDGEPDAEVRQEVWLAQAAQAKQKASQLLARGENHEAAQVLLDHAASAAAWDLDPTAALIRQEAAEMRRLAEAARIEREPAVLSKALMQQSAVASARRGAYTQMAGVRRIQGNLSPKRPEEAKDLIGEVLLEMKKRGYDDERVRKVQLGMQELLDNAMEHGCAGRPDGKVHAEVNVSDHYVRIVVTDDGPGFDFEAKLKHEQEHALEPAKRGRGLLLLKNLADRVDWKTDKGTRAEIVIERRALLVQEQHPPVSGTAGGGGLENFTIDQDLHGERGSVIVRVSGFLDAHTFEQLEETITDLFKRGFYKLIMDVSKVEYISSAGAGVFIGALSEAQDHGGDIVLLCPTQNVREVCDLLGLTQIFRICDDLPSAYAAF